MLGIIIQARLGSKRLPQKVLKSFGGATLLLYLIKRLQTFDVPVVVATTISAEDDVLCDYLDAHKVKYFRGSEENVLERFILTAREFNFTELVRVCADSPFVDLFFLQQLLMEWTGDIDYLSFCYKGRPTVLCHFGVFAEVVSLKALIKLQREYDNLTYLEHVTYGIYKNSSNFKVKLIELPPVFSDYQDIRLTVDTLEDYEIVNYIMKQLPNSSTLSFYEICNFLLENRELIEKMKLIINKNTKA